MLGHFGFSYIGLLFLLMLFVPNIIWIKRQPAGYLELAKNENKFLLLLERVGQILVVASSVLFSDYNPVVFNGWTTWLIISGLIMVIYEICWLRYFKEPTLKNIYGKFLCIPLPLATLPVLAFFILGIYGKVIWLLLSAIVIGIGHIGIHYQHHKTIMKDNRSEKKIDNNRID